MSGSGNMPLPGVGIFILTPVGVPAAYKNSGSEAACQGNPVMNRCGKSGIFLA